MVFGRPGNRQVAARRCGVRHGEGRLGDASRVARTTLTAGLIAAAVLSTPAPARADQDFNLIAFSALGVIGAGMMGDYLRGNDVWASSDPDPFSITVGAGAFNVRLDNETDHGNETMSMVRLEARLPYKLWRLTPITGLEVTQRGSVYGYGGFMLDVHFGQHFLISPNTALGFYSQGDGRDLGFPLEFRSGLEAAYQFDSGSRLGVAYHHISNAELGDRNPGIEELTVNYSLPFDSLFQ